MERRGRWATTGAVVALIVLGVWMVDPFGDAPDGSRRPIGEAGSTAVRIRGNPGSDADSPFAVESSDDTASGSGDASARAGAAVDGADSVTDERTGTERPGTSVSDGGPPVDVAAIGRAELTDEAFDALVARVSGDPVLLAALIDELRAETDPARRSRLMRLLGDVDDPSVSALAVELVYSGDAASRELGLDLLGRVQPGNAEARDVIAGLLSTESDVEVLTGTLTAMAVPGSVAADERAELAEQVSLLTRHADPVVRRTSIDILSRWSESPEHTPLLLDGLVDTDPLVRRTAAYALVGHEHVSEDVMRDLFSVVGNTDEVTRIRRGAILALKGMPLDEERRARLDEIENGLNLRRR